MLLALVAPLLLLAACSSPRAEPPPPDRPTSAAGAASAAPAVGTMPPGARWPALPEAPVPSSRLVVLEPGGALCVLDGDSGALLARQDSLAMDLIGDRSGAGRLATVEPSLSGQESPGVLGRYELRGERLELRSSLPFDAPEGVLLDAEVAFVGLRLSEGTTLFRATHGEGTGRSWGAVTAAAVRPLGSGAVALLTAGFPDEKRMELRYATVNAKGILEDERREVSAGDCGVAVFEGEGAFGVVRAEQGQLRIAWPGRALDGAGVEAPGACIRGARWLGEAQGLAVLTGPTPVLWRWKAGSVSGVPLGDEVLQVPSLPLRELVFDAARGRLWVPVNKELRGVSLEEGRVVATGACPAVRAALVEPLSP